MRPQLPPTTVNTVASNATYGLANGVVLEPQGWAGRLGRTLHTARTERHVSLRALAKDSGGRFTVRDLKEFERGSRPAGDLLSRLLTDLYEVELDGVIPERTSLDVDLSAGLIVAGGASSRFTLDQDPVNATLTAYLELVWALRGVPGGRVTLRKEDVLVLADVLALDEDVVVDGLAELMQCSREDARKLLAILRRRAVVVPASVLMMLGVSTAFSSTLTGLIFPGDADAGSVAALVQPVVDPPLPGSSGGGDLSPASFGGAEPPLRLGPSDGGDHGDDSASSGSDPAKSEAGNGNAESVLAGGVTATWGESPAAHGANVELPGGKGSDNGRSGVGGGFGGGASLLVDEVSDDDHAGPENGGGQGAPESLAKAAAGAASTGGASSVEPSDPDQHLVGTKKADTLTGGSGNDTIEGGKGNDKLSGGAGNDVIDGGAGRDVIDGGTGNDKLSGGAGNDVIDGGAGRDVIDGGTGNDKLSGGAGNDVIDGGAGRDVIDGGTGNDRLSGGAGNDVIDGGAGNDVIDGGAGRDVIDGGTGNDRLSGGAGNDVIDGGAGNDVISGGDGNDVIDGGAGRDVIDGGKGNDKVTGGEGGATAYGGPGNDTYTTTDGAKDVFFGGSGNDKVVGNVEDWDEIDLDGPDAPPAD